MVVFHKSPVTVTWLWYSFSMFCKNAVKMSSSIPNWNQQISHVIKHFLKKCGGQSYPTCLAYFAHLGKVLLNVAGGNNQT